MEQIKENALHHHKPNDDNLKLNSINDLKVFFKYFLLESLYQLNCLYYW